jgi:predicted Holliday junction resolvase-like endonuclease
MITFIIIILSLTIVGLGFAYKEITSLRKEVQQKNQELYHLISRVDKQFENENVLTHHTIREVELDIKALLELRVDKLTTQVILTTDAIRRDIPPTNDELMKRIDDLEEGSHRLRMNL